MTTSPDLEFQAVLNATLSAEYPTLRSAERLGSHPVNSKALPAIHFGETELQEFPARYELRAMVHVWSNLEGPHEVKTYQQRIRELLVNIEFTRDIWTFLVISEEFTDTLRDRDDSIWHGVQRFRVLVS